MDVVRRGSGSSELVLLDGAERSGDTVEVIRTPGAGEVFCIAETLASKHVTLPSWYEKTWFL
jgi:6,7-dimethyl-8-ribityllumazine synthase